MKLIALVGINIEKMRFEPGDRINLKPVHEKQRRFLIREGYAQEVEDGQRVPAEVIEAAIAGAATEHLVVESIDTKEDE